ncbi:MAG: GGDEF domain-containing protein [Deltaproteobacteria bacterium]|nr:GGDEF domain-containing protein [Deltaproteobacteria bacterium]
MSLDLSTLYLVATLVAVTLGGLLLFFWRQERIAALGWWGAAYVIGGVAIGIWTLAGALLGAIPTLVLQLTGFVACGMVWNAARVFHGRPSNLLGVGLGAAAWAVAQFLPQPAGLSVILGAAIVAGYAALTASELWTERRRTYRSRWPAVLIPILHGVVLMLPILLGDVVQGIDGAMEAGNGWVAAFAIELVLYAVGTVFIILMLVSERTVDAHKNAASVDPLTGLFNRRGFSELTERMIRREATAGRGVSVMIFDIDHFKSINDRFGHSMGDTVLETVAAALMRAVRPYDTVARWGGEEFVILLPNVDESAAAMSAERLRREIERTEFFSATGAAVKVSVSIGVATRTPKETYEALLERADRAMYEAKATGRNRVCVAGTDEARPIRLTG